MLRVKNWNKFQSFKDRRPPWIRLHKTFLDDYSFQTMSVQARALLPMIWLLVSEDENPVSGLLRIRYQEIAYRLRIGYEELKVLIDEIIRAGFLERIEDEEPDLFKDKLSQIDTKKENKNNMLQNRNEMVTDFIQNGYSEAEAEYRVQSQNTDATRDENNFLARNRILEITHWDENPNWGGNWGRLNTWLEAGWDLELDILPVIKHIVSRMVKTNRAIPNSLKYFDQAIADAYASRISPTPKGEIKNAPNSNRESKREKMLREAQQFMDSLGSEETD